MTLRELWEKHKDNADLELLFDMNGDGAVSARDATVARLADDPDREVFGGSVIVLTNVKGLYEDGDEIMRE